MAVEAYCMVKTAMPAPLNILHVASFCGNIGDNANHNGAFSRFKSNIPIPFVRECLEIRKTFLNYQRGDRWKFDQDFVRRVNASDACFIGGGNYFELWLENSATGTTIDIQLKLLEEIRKPLIFYALGCDAGMGAKQESVEKFKGFLDVVFENELMSIYLRNDGSRKNLNYVLGKSYADRVDVVPDGGFFIDVGHESALPIVKADRKNIAINIAGDMLELRFPRSGNGYLFFVKKFAEICSKLVDDFDANLIFIPHIYKDLHAINDCLHQLDDFKLRNCVSVAPLLYGEGCEQSVFSIYEKCNLAMSMRFHANVCPIGLGTPTIGLCCYPQISGLYEELGLQENLVFVNNTDFHDRVLSLAKFLLSQPQGMFLKLEQLNKRLEGEVDLVQKKIASQLLTAH